MEKAPSWRLSCQMKDWKMLRAVCSIQKIKANMKLSRQMSGEYKIYVNGLSWIIELFTQPHNNIHISYIITICSNCNLWYISDSKCWCSKENWIHVQLSKNTNHDQYLESNEPNNRWRTRRFDILFLTLLGHNNIDAFYCSHNHWIRRDWLFKSDSSAVEIVICNLHGIHSYIAVNWKLVHTVTLDARYSIQISRWLPGAHTLENFFGGDLLHLSHYHRFKIRFICIECWIVLKLEP